MAKNNASFSFDIFGLIIGWMLMVILASLAGIEGCDCGHGPTVRKNVQDLIHGRCESCISASRAKSTSPKKRSQNN